MAIECLDIQWARPTGVSSGLPYLFVVMVVAAQVLLKLHSFLVLLVTDLQADINIMIAAFRKHMADMSRTKKRPEHSPRQDAQSFVIYLVQ